MQVPSVYWDGVVHQKSNRRKYLSQVDALWESLEDEGLALFRDEPPSQKVSFAAEHWTLCCLHLDGNSRLHHLHMQELQDRRHAAKLARKGLHKESRIDPRFRQQMWKLMHRRPRASLET